MRCREMMRTQSPDEEICPPNYCAHPLSHFVNEWRPRRGKKYKYYYSAYQESSYDFITSGSAKARAALFSELGSLSQFLFCKDLLPNTRKNMFGGRRNAKKIFAIFLGSQFPLYQKPRFLPQKKRNERKGKRGWPWTFPLHANAFPYTLLYSE